MLLHSIFRKQMTFYKYDLPVRLWFCGFCLWFSCFTKLLASNLNPNWVTQIFWRLQEVYNIPSPILQSKGIKMNWESFSWGQSVGACLKVCLWNPAVILHPWISSCWVIILSKVINFGLQLQTINQIGKKKVKLLLFASFNSLGCKLNWNADSSVRWFEL